MVQDKPYVLLEVRDANFEYGILEMIERLQYDMLYYENMSLLIDLKIIIYTVKTVITGKGV